MVKDSYYFSHDANARNDEKILELRLKYGWEGYGLYWAFVEILREATDYRIKASLIGGLSLSFNYPKDQLLQFVKDCCELELLCQTDGYLWSESLKRRMLLKDMLTQQLQEAGKIGAKKRWEKHSPPNTPPYSKGKEKKGNKVNKLNTISNFPFYLNTDFIQTFQDYLEMRIKIRRPATTKAQELVLKELHKYDLKTAVAILEQSIINSWQGVFPLKTKGGKDGRPIKKYTQPDTGKYAGISKVAE